MGCATSATSAHNPYRCSSAEPKENLFQQKYKLGRKLGEGHFGQVRCCTEIATQAKLAVKIIDIRENDKVITANVKLVRNEEEIWRRAGDGQHVVHLVEAFIDQQHSLSYLVMERCEACLMDRLEKVHFARQAVIARVFHEMLQGIRCLHLAGVAHCDIKPNNFLFGGPGGQTIKLGDFGLSQVVPKKGKLYSRLGTGPYMSPEMLDHRGYTELTDMWSFAATVYLLLFGQFPYQPRRLSSQTCQVATQTASPPPTFTPCAQWNKDGSLPPDAAVRFAKWLLVRDPSKRPSAQDALAHEFVARPAAADLRGKQAKTVPAAEPKADGLSCDAPACSMITLAKKHTNEFKTPIDPTVQRELDELLQKLSFHTRSFSTPLGDDSQQTTCSRRESRFSTHDGSISNSVTLWHPSLETPADDMDDLASESTAASRSEKGMPSGPGCTANGQSNHYLQLETPAGGTHAFTEVTAPRSRQPGRRPVI
eukprot:gnl/TRDRNA2_/TRDRNA2_125355_c0_seq5.p1 gnl/TRDRNA2_/TRDRNA2_125355_c0~~gnl/TRDRNA2_/TRDRNA2_125355_c0_seq5.p1  ORF type:complete len:480 (-),score=67.54 gnl/TRDRNA2_/TRDRNA2_125355_c0_seq5:348-1787(-)